MAIWRQLDEVSAPELFVVERDYALSLAKQGQFARPRNNCLSVMRRSTLNSARKLLRQSGFQPRSRTSTTPGTSLTLPRTSANRATDLDKAAKNRTDPISWAPITCLTGIALPQRSAGSASIARCAAVPAARPGFPEILQGSY